jgi:hypothetical protein
LTLTVACSPCPPPKALLQFPFKFTPTHRSTRVGTGHAAAVPPSSVRTRAASCRTWGFLPGVQLASLPNYQPVIPWL